jgi:hypothetical protein
MSFKVGTRVRLPDVSGKAFPVGDGMAQMRQPHPEKVGKTGTITGREVAGRIGGKLFYTPVITLDEGGTVLGSECWWEPIED